VYSVKGETPKIIRGAIRIQFLNIKMAKKVVGFYGDNTSCDGELREENLMTFRH
jgi:hypothetical protein